MPAGPAPGVGTGLPDKGYADPLDWHSPAARLAWFTDEAPARAWLARQRPGEEPARAVAGRYATKRT